MTLSQTLQRYTPEEVSARWADLGRGARESGLESLPEVLAEEDWQVLERGLLQRADLLNAALADAYGERGTLSRGRLPADLYFDNPAWLAPCHGMVDSHLSRLSCIAIEVARCPQAGWAVVRDHCQNPAGFGRLLVFRRWMARAYHELFADHSIMPVAPSLQGLSQTLAELSQHRPGARTVMLTTAVGAPATADDAALAQFLSCPLVEAEDLTVRRGTVYLKLLEGLQPVDTILRRIPDAISDPLEIPTRLWGGVAGLLQAVRAGNVVVTNSLGCGWLESPRLREFWPDLAEEFLQEPLLLPTLPESKLPPESGRLRLFLVATPQGYRLLPGGLAGNCRDLWRRACPEVERHRSLPQLHLQAPSSSLSRGGGDIPSRVAEQFYWFGRYLERTDGLLRFARILLQRGCLSEQQESAADRELAQLLACRPELQGDAAAWASGAGDNQLQSLLTHVQRLGGALSDRLSADFPQAIGALPNLSQRPEAGSTLAYLESLSLPLWALLSLTRESLYRGYGFRFLEIGRSYERALQICELLEAVQKLEASRDILEVLLETCDSIRTYRRRYPSGILWTGVVDLLLADETHPRSLAYQLQQLNEHFGHLPNRDQVGLAVHRRALLRVRSQLQLWTPPDPPPLTELARLLPEVSKGLAGVYLTHLKPSYQAGSQ